MKNRTVKIKIRKNQKEVYLYIKTPKEISDFFKNLSAGEEIQSRKWVNKQGIGCNFYKLTDEINEKINFMQSGVLNDVGASLYSNNMVNIDPLRAVKADKGVSIYYRGDSDFISNSEIDIYLRELAIFVKSLWRKYISEKKINALITIEI